MISFNKYKIISDTIGESYSYGVFSFSELGSASSVLDSLTVKASRRSDFNDLQDSISRSKTNLQSKHIFVSKSLRSVIQGLQILVLKDYASVDAYLSSGDIKVSNTFATLSNISGYPISSDNVDV